MLDPGKSLWYDIKNTLTKRSVYMLKRFLHYCVIVVAAFLVAVSYQIFVFPNRFAPAGLNGICTIIQYLFHFSIGYLNILINIPLCIAIYFLVNKPMALRTMVYALSFSGFTLLLERLDLSAFVYSGTYSGLLGPAVAGIVSGTAFILIGKAGANAGGTEATGILIHKFRPELNFYWVVFALNISVAFLSYFVYGFDMEPVLLCVIYCYASSSIRDQVSRRSSSAIRCEIVTETPEDLSQALIDSLHHSVTLMPATGMYSGKKTNVLVCVINRSQIAVLKNVIHQFPGSFAVFSQVAGVVGNFKRLDSHGLPEKQVL